jgi:Fibronectin type III domain
LHGRNIQNYTKCRLLSHNRFGCSRSTYTYGTAGDKWPTGSKFIKGAYGVPSEPVNFTVNPINGTGSFNLSWEAPLYSSGIVIVSYLVTVTSADATYANSYTVVGTKTTITGLQNQVSYTFTVAGITTLGNGVKSIKTSLSYQVPNQVNDLYGYGYPNSAVLYWNAPNDSIVTSYSVSYVENGKTITSSGITSNETTDIYKLITGLLKPGYDYTFTVYAVNTGVFGPGVSTVPVDVS